MNLFLLQLQPRQIHLIVFLLVGALIGYAAYSIKTIKSI
jgi:hypothetical protein